MSDTTGLIRQTDAGHEEGLEAGERCQLALSRRPCCSHCTIPESTDVCLRVVFGGGGGGVLLGSGGGRCWKKNMRDVALLTPWQETASRWGLTWQGGVEGKSIHTLGGGCPLHVTWGWQV